MKRKLNEGAVISVSVPKKRKLEVKSEEDSSEEREDCNSEKDSKSEKSIA